MVDLALHTFGADPVTYVIPAVVVVGFFIHYKLQTLAGLRAVDQQSQPGGD